MNTWTDVIEGLEARAERNIGRDPEDFVKDGLLYCGKCGGAKQIRVEFGGHVFMPVVLCPCAVERQRAEEEADRRRQEQYRIERLREEAFSEKHMRGWTFENDDGRRPDITGIMKRYVEHFPELRETGKGLLLHGSIGTGKTYSACQVANALVDMGIPCLVTNFAALAARARESGYGKAELPESLSRYALLVIDDLGAERNTEYMQETVYSIIDARYRSGLPMIITTNLELQEMKNPGSTVNARIYDRILERCHPVEIEGKSRRRDAVKEDWARVQRILAG